MTDKIALEKIKAIIVDCLNKAVKVFPNLKEIPQPLVSLDLTGRTAGMHCYRSNAPFPHEIRINRVLLNENVEEMLTQTVPHEVAHMIVTHLFGAERDFFTRRRKVAPHGKEWKMVMGVLGKEATRCHTMDTTNARTRNLRKFSYKCACNTPHNLTSIRHQRIQAGRYTLSCRNCGSQLVWEGSTTAKTAPVRRVPTTTFAKGMVVCFNDKKGNEIKGTIKRVNKKTCTIDTPEGQWRVSPSFLKAKN